MNFHPIITTLLIKRNPIIEPPISTITGRFSISENQPTTSTNSQNEKLEDIKQMIKSLSLRI